MASPFKIPKRKQPAESSGSDCLSMQSPLSRLQDGAAAFKRNWEQPGGRAGNALGCRESVVRSLLGLNCSAGVSAANQRTGTTLTARSANHRADHAAKSPWSLQSWAGTPTHGPGRRAAESPTSGLQQRQQQHAVKRQPGAA